MPRPSNKEDSIKEALRERIVAGIWAPGGQLPTYAKLIEEFSTSLMTIRKVLGKLKADGFLEGVERKGVYVAAKPPHLNRIALLLGAPGRANRFMRSLEISAADFNERGGKRIEVFSNLNGRFFRLEETKRLKEELDAKRFGGMIVAFNPADCPDSEIFGREIPTAYCSSSMKGRAGNVEMEPERFIERALQRLREKGASKIAALAYPFNNPALALTAAALEKRGFSSKPEWLLSMDNPELAESLVKLLLKAPAQERPDGLLLLDDHLAEHVSKGVFAAKANVPEELKIVCHCNWALPPQKPFQMDLLGYDGAKVLETALRMIAGETPCGNGGMEPLFEEELLASRTVEREGSAA